MDIDDLFRVYEQELTRCRFTKHLPERYAARLSTLDIDMLASLQFVSAEAVRRRVRVKRVSHVCSRLCEFISDPEHNSDIMICLATGNVHRCGSHRCNMQLTTKEFRLCRRTLRQFPLWLVSGRKRHREDGAGEDMGDGDNFEEESNHVVAVDSLDERSTVDPSLSTIAAPRAPRSKRMRFGLFKNAADEDSPLTSPVQREQLTGIPQRLPKSCHPASSHIAVAPTTGVNLEADAKAVITRALVAGMKLWAVALGGSDSTRRDIRPPEAVVDSAASRCLFWWSRIIQCRAFLDNAFSYKFPTHCLVMLSLMVDGFRVDGHVVVEPDSYVRVALPGGNALKRNLGIKPGLLTNSEKFFRRCIAEWLSKDKGKAEYQIAMNRRLRGSTVEMLRIEAPAEKQLGALQAPVSVPNGTPTTV